MGTSILDFITEKLECGILEWLRPDNLPMEVVQPEKDPEVIVFCKRAYSPEIIHFVFGVFSRCNESAKLLELPYKEVRPL